MSWYTQCLPSIEPLKLLIFFKDRIYFVNQCQNIQKYHVASCIEVTGFVISLRKEVSNYQLDLLTIIVSVLFCLPDLT